MFGQRTSPEEDLSKGLPEVSIEDSVDDGVDGTKRKEERY